jgi:hypothetical protein
MAWSCIQLCWSCMLSELFLFNQPTSPVAGPGVLKCGVHVRCAIARPQPRAPILAGLVPECLCQGKLKIPLGGKSATFVDSHPHVHANVLNPLNVPLIVLTEWCIGVQNYISACLKWGSNDFWSVWFNKEGNFLCQRTCRFFPGHSGLSYITNCPSLLELTSP